MDTGAGAVRNIAGLAGGFARRVNVGGLGNLADLPFNVKALVEAGIIRPMPPQDLLAVGRSLRRWGASPAAGIDRPPPGGRRRRVIDELGELTFGELDRRSNSLGAGAGQSTWSRRLGRGHVPQPSRLRRCDLRLREAGRVGAPAQHGLRRPQLLGVIEREQPQAVIYDSEFQGLLGGAEARKTVSRFVSSVADGEEITDPCPRRRSRAPPRRRSIPPEAASS